MKREIDDKTILEKFAEDFCKIVEKHVRYIICSGFVAIVHGRARGTEDIDMIIQKLEKQKFVNLHKDLIKAGFVCIQSGNPERIYEYLDNGSSVRYVIKSEGYFPPEMEIKFQKDSLDEEQLKDRIKLPLTKLDIYFSSIESNIACQEPPVTDWWHEDATLRVVLEHTQNSTSDSNHSSQTSGILMFKEEYLKSDKDLEDAKHLRIIYSSEIDENKINKIKEKIRILR